MRSFQAFSCVFWPYSELGGRNAEAKDFSDRGATDIGLSGESNVCYGAGRRQKELFRLRRSDQREAVRGELYPDSQTLVTQFIAAARNYGLLRVTRGPTLSTSVRDCLRCGPCTARWILCGPRSYWHRARPLIYPYCQYERRNSQPIRHSACPDCPGNRGFCWSSPAVHPAPSGSRFKTHRRSRCQAAGSGRGASRRARTASVGAGASQWANGRVRHLYGAHYLPVL